MSQWLDYADTNSGYVISPVHDITDVGKSTSTSISWTKNAPTGSSVTVYTRLSFNKGNTWEAWKEATSGGSIPDIVDNVTDLSNAYMQYKIEFANTDVVVIPEVTDVTVDIASAYTYPTSQAWYSDVMDLRDEKPDTTTVVWNASKPTGTDVEVYSASSGDGTNWGSWVKVLASGDDIPDENLYHKFKVVLKSSTARTSSPVVNDLTITASNCDPRGYWESPVIQMTDSVDYSSVYVYNSSTIVGGTKNIQTRSSVDGIVWSPWYQVLGNSATQHPAREYIQARAYWTGSLSEIQSLTISYAGTPSITELVSGLTEDVEWNMVTFDDYVYACDGADALKKYDGSTWDDAGGSPAVMSILEVHNNRLWGVEADSSTVYFSDIGDGETWDPLNFIQFNPDDGDTIKALKRFGQSLVVMKSRSKALLTGDRTSNYAVTWLETPTGAVSSKAVTATNSLLAFLSSDGLRVTDLVRERVVTDKLTKSWDEVNKARLNKASIMFWDDLLLLSLPVDDSHNNEVWCFNPDTDAWSKYDDWEISNWVKFNLLGTELLYGSDSAKGQLYEMMSGSVDIDVPVEYDWTSKNYIFGYPERFKLYKNFYLDFDRPEVETSVELSFIVDDAVVSTNSVPIPASTSDGDSYQIRLIPPSYNVILGYRFAFRLQGTVPLRSVKVEYEMRSAVPPTTLGE